jgi:multiple sugar transport system permease protein
MSITQPTDAPAAGSSPTGRSTGIRSGQPANNTKRGKPHYGIHLFLIVLAIMWLIPLVWTIFTALRPKADTDKYGYFSFGGSFNFDNFSQAWTQGGFAQYAWNSALITIPSVILVLFFASMMAFAVSRVNWKFNITLLIMFTAGNLLNTYIAVIIVDTAFQIGFCTFVLSNYMKALSADLTEAALVDGAGIWRQYWNIILPLCRPALAALGTLEVIFIYNDFFWPLLFIQSGDRLPITTAINNLQGQFLSNYNLIAAGAMITLIPTLLIYLVLQRQFVAGLTLGSSKG